MRTHQIRAMTARDVDAATNLLAAGDWGDRRSWFEFATTQPECRPIVAESEGEIVGTGVGTVNGGVGWVGTIFVPDRLRGRGLGGRLTERVCEDLDGAGCRTVVLVSTPKALPLYRRLGFVEQTRYEILEAPGLPFAGDLSAARGPEVAAVRPFEPNDLTAMAALDVVATGEDRAHALRRFATPASAKVLVGAGGTIRGFVVRAPWGGGATIASTPDDAMAILDARRRAAGPNGRVRVGIVAENEAGLRRLRRDGLRPIWQAPRLARGHPLAWQPDRIWGQFNHAMG